jgi:hypothetical protein
LEINTLGALGAAQNANNNVLSLMGSTKQKKKIAVMLNPIEHTSE